MVWYIFVLIQCGGFGKPLWVQFSMVLVSWVMPIWVQFGMALVVFCPDSVWRIGNCCNARQKDTVTCRVGFNKISFCSQPSKINEQYRAYRGSIGEERTRRNKRLDKVVMIQTRVTSQRLSVLLWSSRDDPHKFGSYFPDVSEVIGMCTVSSYKSPMLSVLWFAGRENLQHFGLRKLLCRNENVLYSWCLEFNTDPEG